jgi:YVTN family beta-propeller protein
MDLRPGAEFAGYLIERELGRGGMGVVYLAEQQFPRRKVALKLLPRDLATDEKFRERFVRESNLAASIDHPNIIPILAAGEQDGVLYIAMRYVAGLDLKELIRREGPLDLERTDGIVSQAAAAVDAAHRRGLVHRDVKAANILVVPGEDAEREHVYLSDFGLTKRMSSDSGLTGTGQFVGTLDYAAPEQFEGKPLDAGTDVYSLGCVLYECLVGEVPFRRESEAALVYAHLHDPPARPTQARPDLPAGVDDVVRRALAKSPDDRFPSCGVLAAAFRQVTGAPSISPPAPGRTPRRHAVLASVLGTGALVAVTVIVLLLRTGSSTRAPESSPTTGPGPSASTAPGQSPVPEIKAVTLTEIDARAARLVQSAVIGGDFAGPVAAGQGGIWMGQGTSDRFARGPLLHVDPDTLDVEASVTGVSPYDLAVAPHTWVWASCGGADLVAIDPSTDTRVRSIRLPRSGNAFGCTASLAIADGSVWVLDDQEDGLYRFDALTGEDQGSTRLENPVGSREGIAFGERALWALDSFDGRMYRVDPRTGRVVALVPIQGAQPLAVAAGEGSVWVLLDNGILLVVDPDRDEVRTSVPLPTRHPRTLAVAGGAVWVAGNVGDGPDGVVLEIDPATLEVVASIPVGGFPRSIAVERAKVWVSIQPTAQVGF